MVKEKEEDHKRLAHDIQSRSTRHGEEQKE